MKTIEAICRSLEQKLNLTNVTITPFSDGSYVWVTADQTIIQEPCHHFGTEVKKTKRVIHHKFKSFNVDKAIGDLQLEVLMALKDA